MWFEILPSFGVVLASLAATHVLAFATNWLFLGNTYKRSLDTFDEYHHFLRDKRISGINFPYKQVGLECIDEEVKKEEEEKCVCP